LSDEGEGERRPIRVVVDTSSNDSEFVELNEIQDHVPLKHRTLASLQEVPGVRGAEAVPLTRELLSPSVVILSSPHLSAAVDLYCPRRAEAIIDRPSSSATGRCQGCARPATMERNHEPLAVALEGRPHPRVVPREVRHHLAWTTVTERHPHL
jgi:hypothetical protein